MRLYNCIWCFIRRGFYSFSMFGESIIFQYCILNDDLSFFCLIDLTYVLACVFARNQISGCGLFVQSAAKGSGKLAWRVAGLGSDGGDNIKKESRSSLLDKVLITSRLEGNSRVQSTLQCSQLIEPALSICCWPRQQERQLGRCHWTVYQIDAPLSQQ